MSFLTFLLYFSVSMAVYELILFGLIFIFRVYGKYKMTQAIKDGKIKTLNLSDILDKEDKTWN